MWCGSGYGIERPALASASGSVPGNWTVGRLSDTTYSDTSTVYASVTLPSDGTAIFHCACWASRRWWG